MYEIIVATHGFLADSYKDTLSLFVGEESDVVYINLGDQGIDGFEKQAKEKLSNFMDKKVVVLCDLYKGTPFNVFAKLSFDFPEIEVIGNLTLSLLLDLYLSKSNSPLESALSNLENHQLRVFSNELKSVQDNTDDE